MGFTPVNDNPEGRLSPLADYSRLETTAAAQFVMKQGLGLVKNTLDLAFYELTEDPFRKYKGEPSHPELSFPLALGIVRPDPADHSLWIQTYQELVNSLPVQLRIALEEALRREDQEIDPDLKELNLALQEYAQVLVWAKEVGTVKQHEGLRAGGG